MAAHQSGLSPRCSLSVRSSNAWPTTGGRRQLSGGRHIWLTSLLCCLITTRGVTAATIATVMLGLMAAIADATADAHTPPMHHRHHTPQSNNHANISELLDNLLRGYDNSIRPGFGGTPAVVEVDIMVRSMGPISEVDMTYSMDCYFRQSWVDRRLAFTGAQDTLALSISMLAKIWKPDTYFYNGKQSYLHTITTPNKFVRLYQDGRVLYSSRLTIKAGCPMNLADFPMDVQRCPLKFGSFGYTTTDLIYKWNGNRQAVTIAEDMKLSQFDLVDCPAGNMTDVIGHGSSAESKWGDNYAEPDPARSSSPLAEADEDRRKARGDSSKTQLNYVSEYSMLLVNFHLQRHMGNFLIQVYGPCVLLVVLSWVSFWLNREATADRVSLGITTVLTMTFLGLEARTDLPKVPYPTALDFFVFLSFAFIFATIIQFAIVHYFTKYGSGEYYFSPDFESDSSDLDEDNHYLPDRRPSQSAHTSTILNSVHARSNDARIFEVIPLSSCSMSFAPITPTNKLSTNRAWYTRWWPCHRKPVVQSSGSFQEWDNVEAFGALPSKNISSPSVREVVPSNKCVLSSLATSTDTTTVTISAAQPPPLRTTSSTINNHHHRHNLKRISFPNLAAGVKPPDRTKQRPKRMPRFNSVSKIDRASRVFFPLVFFVINLFYWYSYLTKSERWVTQSVLMRQ